MRQLLIYFLYLIVCYKTTWRDIPMWPHILHVVILWHSGTLVSPSLLTHTITWCLGQWYLTQVMCSDVLISASVCRAQLKCRFKCVCESTWVVPIPTFEPPVVRINGGHMMTFRNYTNGGVLPFFLFLFFLFVLFSCILGIAVRCRVENRYWW